uniref:Uncharacterized protein n=1 Tax=Fagus sylvatica TaxID=28930 RepID=A0A2N9EI70_FAGSY
MVESPLSLFFPPHAASPSHSHARRLSHQLTISSHGLDLSLSDSISQSQSQSLTLRLDQSQKLTVTAAITLTELTLADSWSHGCSLSLRLSFHRGNQELQTVVGWVESSDV